MYVPGYEYNASNNVAKLGKNGVAISFLERTNYAYAKSVFVSGTDIYVARFEVIGGHYVARLWKNGVPTTLSSIQSHAEPVFISGTDAYVTGNEFDRI